MNEQTFKLLQHTIASLEQQVQKATSRIDALEAELGELENIITHCGESKLRTSVFNWLQRRRGIAV